MFNITTYKENNYMSLKYKSASMLYKLKNAKVFEWTPTVQLYGCHKYSAEPDECVYRKITWYGIFICDDATSYLNRLKRKRSHSHLNVKIPSSTYDFQIWNYGTSSPNIEIYILKV